MFTGSSPTEGMLSGATNFGQDCPHTLLSNRYWWGAWRRVMVLREGGAWQNPNDLFGICKDLPALKWTMRCSNWHQSHIRRVNNKNTYHRQGKQGALLIQKTLMSFIEWRYPFDADPTVRNIAWHLDLKLTFILRKRLLEWSLFINWLDTLHSFKRKAKAAPNGNRLWRSLDRSSTSIPMAHYLRISGKRSGQCSDLGTL